MPKFFEDYLFCLLSSISFILFCCGEKMMMNLDHFHYFPNLIFQSQKTELQCHILFASEKLFFENWYRWWKDSLQLTDICIFLNYFGHGTMLNQNRSFSICALLLESAFVLYHGKNIKQRINIWQKVIKMSFKSFASFFRRVTIYKLKFLC